MDNFNTIICHVKNPEMTGGLPLVARKLLTPLHRDGMGDYDVHVAAWHHHGTIEAKPYGYLHPQAADPDWGGSHRVLRGLVGMLSPEAVVGVGDPWMLSADAHWLGKEVEGGPPYMPYLTLDSAPFLPQWASLIRHSRRVLVTSRWGKQIIEQSVGAQQHVHVLPLGHDPSMYSTAIDRIEARAYWKLPDSAFVVCAVGYNQMRKNYSAMLQAWQKFVQAYGGPCALVIHTNTKQIDGPDLDGVAAALGVSDSVTFTYKPLDEAELAKLYRASDVMLSTSYAEGGWLPGIEAAACGCAVVAPRHGAYLDWADVPTLYDPNGWQWSRQGSAWACTDPAVVAQKLLELAEDRGLLRWCQQRSPALVADLTWEKTAKTYENHLKEICNAHTN